MSRDDQLHDTLPQNTLHHEERRARRPQTSHRLLRSRQDRWIAGVLGGIATYVGASPTTVRFVFVAATVLSGGIIAIGYGLLWILLPPEPA